MSAYPRPDRSDLRLAQISRMHLAQAARHARPQLERRREAALIAYLIQHTTETLATTPNPLSGPAARLLAVALLARIAQATEPRANDHHPEDDSR